MTKHRVVLYETKQGRCPVADFINRQEPRTRAKIARAIDLLADYGPSLGMPYVRRIGGSKMLWELRVPFGGNNYRVFWFGAGRGTLVLVHGIQKKTRRTPLRDIRAAEQRVTDFLHREVA